MSAAKRKNNFVKYQNVPPTFQLIQQFDATLRATLIASKYFVAAAENLVDYQTRTRRWKVRSDSERKSL